MPDRPPAPGTCARGWQGAGRLVLAATKVAVIGALTGWLVWRDGQRADSPVAMLDDHLLAQVQKFLPGGRGGALILESRPDTDTRVFAPRPQDTPLPVDCWKFSTNDRATLMAWPPGPVDVAVLMQCLAENHPASITLAQPPVWGEATRGTLAARTFQAARASLGGIPFAVAMDPGFSAAPPDDAATRLDGLVAVAAPRVRGDITRVPVINDPGPPVAEDLGLSAADFGFARLLVIAPLDAPPGRVAIPLLARSGDRFVLALPLLAACRISGIDPAAIDVHLGKAILAGPLAIPIDARGCLLLPVHFLKRVPTRSPLDLIAANQGAGVPSMPAHGRHAVISHDSLPVPGGDTTKAGNTGDWIAASLGSILSGDHALPVRVLKRAPLATTTIIVVAMVLAAMLSLLMARAQRTVVALVLLASYAVAACHAAGAAGLFHAMACPLAAWFAAFATAMAPPPPAKRPGAPTAE